MGLIKLLGSKITGDDATDETELIPEVSITIDWDGAGEFTKLGSIFFLQKIKSSLEWAFHNVNKVLDLLTLV